MNTDIKSLIPSMHAELKRMQSRVAELQVSLQQGSSDEKAIREEISRMNLRQVEIMDAMVEIQEYILGKQEALLALLRERKSLLTAKEALEKKNKEYEEKLFFKSYKLLKDKYAFDLMESETAVKMLKTFQSEISKLATMPQRVHLTPEEPWHGLGVRRLRIKNYYAYFWA